MPLRGWSVTDLQSIQTTLSTTLRELLEEAFTRGEFAAGLDRVQAWVALHRDELMNGLLKVLQLAHEAIQALDSMPPVLGYEPLLIEGGQHRLVARVMACVWVRSCEEIAADERIRGRVVADIRFLAKPGRTKGAIRRRATKLLAALERISTLDAFGEVGLIAVRFDEELKAAAQGDPVACEGVTQTAAILAPRLSVPRGRKRSAASVAHEILSSEMTQLFGPAGYTWDPEEGDFVDRFTRATRDAFGDPDFDPRPALRRAKRRGGPPTVSSAGIA